MHAHTRQWQTKKSKHSEWTQWDEAKSGRLKPVNCSNDRATIGSYTILLLQSSSSNIPSHSWPNQSSDMTNGVRGGPGWERLLYTFTIITHTEVDILLQWMVLTAGLRSPYHAPSSAWSPPCICRRNVPASCWTSCSSRWCSRCRRLHQMAGDDCTCLASIFYKRESHTIAGKACDAASMNC